MRQFSCLLPAVTLVASAFAPTPPPKLQQLLNEAHMTLTVPPGWVATPVIANPDMSYDYALRYPNRRIEIRYALRPLAGRLAEYARSLKQKNETMLNPNEGYQMVFRTVKLNVGPTPGKGHSMEQQLDAEFGQELNEIPPQAVKAEFGASWGATAIFLPRRSFAQAYKNCILVGIHKNNAADAYCFYLFDNQKDLEALVFNDPSKAAFHSLRFK